MKPYICSTLLLSTFIALTGCDSSPESTAVKDARFDINEYQNLMADPEAHSLEGRWLMIGKGKLSREESAYINNKPRLEEEYEQTFELREIAYIRKNPKTQSLEFVSCDGTGSRPLTVASKNAKTTFGSQANDLELTEISPSHLKGIQSYEEKFSDTKVEQFTLNVDLYRMGPDTGNLGNLTLNTQSLGQVIPANTPLALKCFSETIGEYSLTDHDKMQDDPDFMQTGTVHEMQVEAQAPGADQIVAVEVNEISDGKGVKEIESSINLTGKGTEDAIYSFWNRSSGSAPSLDLKFQQSKPNLLEATFNGKADINQAFNGKISVHL